MYLKSFKGILNAPIFSVPFLKTFLFSLIILLAPLSCFSQFIEGKGIVVTTTNDSIIGDVTLNYNTQRLRVEAENSKKSFEIESVVVIIIKDLPYPIVTPNYFANTSLTERNYFFLRAHGKISLLEGLNGDDGFLLIKSDTLTRIKRIGIGDDLHRFRKINELNNLFQSKFTQEELLKVYDLSGYVNGNALAKLVFKYNGRVPSKKEKSNYNRPTFGIEASFGMHIPTNKLFAGESSSNEIKETIPFWQISVISRINNSFYFKLGYNQCSFTYSEDAVLNFFRREYNLILGKEVTYYYTYRYEEINFKTHSIVGDFEYLIFINPNIAISPQLGFEYLIANSVNAEVFSALGPNVDPGSFEYEGTLTKKDFESNHSLGFSGGISICYFPIKLNKNHLIRLSYKSSLANHIFQNESEKIDFKMSKSLIYLSYSRFINRKVSKK